MTQKLYNAHFAATGRQNPETGFPEEGLAMIILRGVPSFLNGKNTNGRLIKDSRISAARGVGLARNVLEVTGIRALILAIFILVPAACASAPAFSQDNQSLESRRGALIYIFNTHKVEFRDCDSCHIFLTSLTRNQICTLRHQANCPDQDITVYIYLKKADLRKDSNCTQDHHSGCLDNPEFGKQIYLCDCNQIDHDH